MEGAIAYDSDNILGTIEFSILYMRNIYNGRNVDTMYSKSTQSKQENQQKL